MKHQKNSGSENNLLQKVLKLDYINVEFTMIKNKYSMIWRSSSNTASPIVFDILFSKLIVYLEIIFEAVAFKY